MIDLLLSDDHAIRAKTAPSIPHRCFRKPATQFQPSTIQQSASLFQADIPFADHLLLPEFSDE